MTATAATSSTAAVTSYAYQPTSSLDAASVTSTDSADQQDRFLKLLVAQLNNQDPLNPMDNSQMTSQIAQINTVTGITKLNDTVKAMSDQFSAAQMINGSAMVGHTVLTNGSAMTLNGTTATGVFDLDAGATGVKVQITTPGGVVLDTLQLGAMDAGSHSFNWDASAYPNTAVQFKVTATNGSDPVTSTTYMRDVVQSVGMDNGALAVQLQTNGQVAYDKIKAIL